MRKFTRIAALALAPATALALCSGAAATAVAPAALPARAVTLPAAHPEAAPEANAVQTVTAFFDQYKRAALGAGPYTPQEVRDRFLTPDLNEKLDAWAAEHDADPVFRAQNVPQRRSVAREAGDPDSTKVLVTEYFSGGAPTKVRYTVSHSTDRIVAIENA
ncbi:hypothetical protein [Streptomyces sp. NPDC088258]|uniref:hypothetical protein n=1 Tax=Streptomyces sp. NPDC088258 TaxID=3365849 RepID=UPI00381999E4